MKRIIFVFIAVVMSTVVYSAAMSNSRVRKETRFLTDKMAYELNLNTEQYNDVYEINYDFINAIRFLMDDVLRGEEWALNRYYDYLDVRNDDLRWVLSSRQYGSFMQASCFYRPVYVSGGRWEFRVYLNYTNHNHFYFPRPYHYRTYCGGHYRTHYPNMSYYRGRYNHSAYSGAYRIRDNRSYRTTRHSDFGSVNIRPDSGVRPSGTTRTGNYSRGTTRRSRVNTESEEGRSSSSGVRRSRSESNTRRSNFSEIRSSERESSHSSRSVERKRNR
ncbi:hypothetical protein [Bacteroides helcogenes]|uniref:Uncharacterized protein n=1 Tax=Bacteroides helcogenes (strain ATCC 35417 / DSM 20613 / JCM 6297 / CCUG 15421 / P 36-108) TaxID=693979 RepID=E6STT8_BACT6|nr:hypothetical protein [Bacteroides helcogenes]ADV42291.1 hypothetical protein Bache_0261 [Bacteroides helcogenes P 36-108]MDY5237255.1 hypothetical protein [Bacteroides helcogenes]